MGIQQHSIIFLQHILYFNGKYKPIFGLSSLPLIWCCFPDPEGGNAKIKIKINDKCFFLAICQNAFKYYSSFPVCDILEPQIFIFSLSIQQVSNMMCPRPISTLGSQSKNQIRSDTHDAMVSLHGSMCMIWSQDEDYDGPTHHLNLEN